MDEEEIEPGLIEHKQNEGPEVNSLKTYTLKIDVIEEKSTIDSIVTNQEKSTLLGQRQPIIAHAMRLPVQLPKGISISPCNFPVELSAFAQAISINLNKLKCFDPGGMIFLLFLPISSVFILVQFPSRV